jgi:hypothetical protein
LSDDEIDYLVEAYASMQRDPSEVELMMFAQLIRSTAGTRSSMPGSRSTASSSRRHFSG